MNQKTGVFAALYGVAAAITLAWLHFHRAPPNWDDAFYLSNSLTLYDRWTTGGLSGLVAGGIGALGFKAPLITALPLPFYLIFGRRWHFAFLVNIASMLVLFAAVWGIGERLRGARAGLIAVYVTATMPLLYGLSRWYLVEYPLAACVALTFWLFAESGSPILLGVLCGFGLLLKVSFPVFIAVPLAMALARTRGPLRMFLEITIPCLLIAGPWYAFHWRATVGNAIDAGFGMSAIVQGTGPIFSLRAVSAYLQIVAERGVSFYYLALLILSIVFLLQRRQFQSLRGLSLLAWWIAPFLVFLFGGNKDVRYIAPILPAFALAVACLLDAALERWRPVLLLALIFPFVSMLAVSFHWPYASRDIGYAAHYNPNTWLHDEILRAIADDTLVHPGQKKLILIATDRGLFNADNFKLTAVQNQLPFEMITTAYEQNPIRLLEMANDASYVIYKEGGEPGSAFFNTRGADLIARLRKLPDWSEVVFGQTLPDGGVARILRHR